MEKKLFKVKFWRWESRIDDTMYKCEYTTYCNKMEKLDFALSYYCYVIHNGKEYETLHFDDNKLISCEEVK